MRAGNAFESCCVALLWVCSVTVGPIAAAADPAVPVASERSVESEVKGFREALDTLQRALVTNSLSSNADVRAQAIYLSQTMDAIALNMYLTPRTQYPFWFNQSNYMPLEVSWGAPNADFKYNDVFIDGAHTYRIYGNRRSSYWATLQVFKGFWGDDDQSSMGIVDFEDLPADPDGNFEIFLGPNPPEKTDGKTWFKLDPDSHNMFLILREVFLDWERDAPLDLHIEILDRDPNATVTLSEREIVERLGRARKFVEVTTPQLLEPLQPLAEKGDPSRPTYRRNVFIRHGQDTAKYGANPLACYGSMIYDLGPDEALIMELDPPKGNYWGFQIYSPWQQSANYIYRKTSINAFQAKLDADGKFRAVVAMSDPGVANWLDPAGVSVGVVGMRYYKVDGCQLPATQKVKLSRLWDYLPAGTPAVTPEQRREGVALRRAARWRHGQ